MKKIFALFLALCFIGANAATTLPVQLLNPTGSTSGQTIVSTGASSAPGWGAVPANGLAAIAANSVLANVTGSAASPTAVAMPSCSTANSALKYTSASGWTCGTTFSLTTGTLAQFAATTSAQLAGVISDETGTGSLVFATGAAINPASTGLTTPGSGAFTTFSVTSTITGVGGRLLNVQKFTANGTYTPTPGANTAIACGIGGGGGGTGAPATASTTYSVGGGGGGGAFGCIRITSGLTTETVTIGTGGATASGAAGSAGTATSFGSLMVLPGGSGGTGPFGPTANAFFTTLISSTAAPSGSGSFLYSSMGYPSSIGLVNPVSTNTVAAIGGISPYGYAGGFGTGGNGAANAVSAAASSGTAGTGGVIFVYEYQ